MKAMVLERITSLARNAKPLSLTVLPDPKPQPGQVLIQVLTCGVCHTELDEIEGRTPPPALPMILGHQIVGRVLDSGPGAGRFAPGDRVGVGWIFSACGQCRFCRQGLENLCPEFKATGRDAPGGYAEFMTVPQDFAYPIPASFSEAEAAPLLCAGAIGHRSLSLANLENGQNLGLTGFGASAHLVLKEARFLFPDSPIFVFARNPKEREFAMSLGAVWAGTTEEQAPDQMAAIIDTTPAYKPVVCALENLEPGGRLVINAIRKESVDQDDLSRIDYPRHLWMEKEIKSVANVARKDIIDFLNVAAQIPIKPEYREFELTQANQCLTELKQGKIRGAKVLRISS